MAGFFGLFDYTKEGPGVYPDEPPKGPFATFFAILGRKFWKIVTINLMYFVFSLPAIIIAFFGANFVVSAVLPSLTPEWLAELFEQSGILLQEGISFLDFANIQILQLYVIVAMLLVGLNLVIVGPVHAGVVYLLRNYSREEHAFVWMDFKEHARNNLRQSLGASLLSLGLTALFVLCYAFYQNNAVFGSTLFQAFLKMVVVIMFVIWCMMQIYLYPMMITFDLSLKQLLRNSFLFALFRLPLNLLILLCSFIIMFVVPGILLFLGYGISVLAAFVWYVCFAFAFNIFLTTFFAYRALNKHMIQRITAQESEGEAVEDAEDLEEIDEDDEEDEEESRGAERRRRPDQGEEPEPGLARAPISSDAL